MRQILLVDDEEYIRRMMALILQEEGFKCLTAADGPTAIDLIKAEEIDVMISDVRMRPMDGIQLLKLAKTYKPGLTVIMITAYSSMETRQAAMSLGAKAFLNKPFDIVELLEELGKNGNGGRRSNLGTGRRPSNLGTGT